ncbi:MAG: RluA family pseudouridine synthase [Candidatus Omnitrophica bacterium]|nr:RluA family pseudouridine synthase [Candidatus Omnitrophota bacterium]
MENPYEIVFNDEFLIVVNKTAKILVHPTPKKEKHTLTALLKENLRENVFPCHRLDRQTTGLLIYAKDKKSHKNIASQFKQQQVQKRYIAFVKGGLKKKKGVLVGNILDKEGRRFGEKEKLAKTIYRQIMFFDGFSVVELRPLTGRTNQLRIQLSECGNPILGEDKYALRRNFTINFKRLALHAFFLSFIHPISKERVDLKLDLPKDMKEFLNKRRQNEAD